MHKTNLTLGDIPVLTWGAPSDKAVLYVHGKMSRKEYAESFARIAAEKGWQTVSFDLPEHGERAGDGAILTTSSGVTEVGRMCEYMFANWKRVSLFACSLGAYFSLHACADRPFEQCLFQSPIVDMDSLIANMFTWFQLSPERLQAEQVIPTPVSTMYWSDYQFTKAHPVERWTIPTRILYGGLDNLQNRESVVGFAERFGCRLTIAEGSEHPFMAENDAPIVEGWMRESLS